MRTPSRTTPDRELGAIAILMAVCLVVIMGFAAFGFDLAYVRYARLQLQNATDAAAHAALVRLRTTGNNAQASAAAISVAAQNRVWGKPLTLQSSDISLGGWDFSLRTFVPNLSPANAVQINGSRSALTGADGAVALSFGRVLGRSSVNLTHSGVAAFRIRSVVIEQDITGSFSDAIDAAGAADVTLLDALHSFNVASDRVAMEVFTGAATPFTPLSTLQTNYAAIRAQWAGDGKPVTDATKTSGLTLCNKLDLYPASGAYGHAWMPACSTGGDGTNQGAAIRSATNVLLTQSQPYETRVIVLVTDGQPECCTTSGTTVSCSTSNACAQQRALDGTSAADAADAEGISVFTVSLGADPAQTLYNASLVRGIGTSFDTPDPNDLASIMTQIAGSVPLALVR